MFDAARDVNIATVKSKSKLRRSSNTSALGYGKLAFANAVVHEISAEICARRSRGGVFVYSAEHRVQESRAPCSWGHLCEHVDLSFADVGVEAVLQEVVQRGYSLFNVGFAGQFDD